MQCLRSRLLASEVRRLRDELDSAKARAEAAEADAASWADQCSQRVADWDEMRIRAEAAESALKEAQEQEQEPVAWLVRHDQAQQLSVQIMKTEAEFEGKEMQYWYRNHSEDGEDIPAVIEPLYARPVPANLVESHQIKRILIPSNSRELKPRLPWRCMIRGGR